MNVIVFGPNSGLRSAFHTPLLNSYRSQVEHYTAYIKQKKKWKFAGIYSDEAITGTRVAKREDFQRLINDCLNGDVDMILTKSMIRFIRMTRSIVRSEQLLRYKKSGGNIMLPPDYIDVFCGKGYNGNDNFI